MPIELISVDFSLINSDLFEAAKQYYRGRPQHRRSLFVAFWFWFLAIVSFKIHGVALLPITWAIIGTIFWLQIPALVMLVAGAAKIAKRSPQLLIRRNLTFGLDGVDIQTEPIRTYMNWYAFTQIIESTNLLLLEYGPWSYLIIPKRAFSPDQLSRLLILCRKMIPGEFRCHIT